MPVLSFDGHDPEIDPTAWIAPSATVIGRVRVHERASAFYGAVLRADAERIELGAGSNLQDNVVVHADAGAPALIGAGVSVGHGAVIHGCVIGDGSLIGMNATVLNRAQVGAESLIAAGALVLEGTVIPPRSLVAGVPGKVRRELSDDEVAGLRRNAEHYLELSSAHARLTS
jgi:carbonic anhydrase/acetyltransferase-like protein (isoleucine patch superfamily)